MVLPISIDALVSVAEIVGGVAVIASLLFVARQMRENNESSREANYIQVMQHNKDMGRLIGSDVEVEGFEPSCFVPLIVVNEL